MALECEHTPLMLVRVPFRFCVRACRPANTFKLFMCDPDTHAHVSFCPIESVLVGTDIYRELRPHRNTQMLYVKQSSVVHVACDLVCACCVRGGSPRCLQAADTRQRNTDTHAHTPEHMRIRSQRPHFALYVVYCINRSRVRLANVRVRVATPSRSSFDSDSSQFFAATQMTMMTMIMMMMVLWWVRAAHTTCLFAKLGNYQTNRIGTGTERDNPCAICVLSSSGSS